MASNNTKTLWKTTVIVSASLQNKEISALLLAQQHLLRYSDSIEAGTLVFPLSGVAFLLIAPEEFPEKAESEEFLKRIEKFIQVHRNSFLLLQAPAYGTRELEIASVVQNRFFGSNLKVLPAHSNGDAVKGMLTIAKCYAHTGLLEQKFCCKKICERFGVIWINALMAHKMSGATRFLMQATSKPHVDCVRERMHLARAHVIQRSLETLLKKVDIFKVI